jgi:dihydroorotate dehydrogenase (fumarate)
VNIDLKTDLFGIILKSPLILGSGPLSYNAEGIIRAYKAGAGAVVTKTIRDQAAINPYPHMAISGRDTMINAEKWSDISAEMWVEQEIPKAKEAGVVVIASIGHTPGEVMNWAAAVDKAGADMIELVSYRQEMVVPMVRKAKELTSKPVIAKLSPNWQDPVTTALAALDQGADGVTAMDSVGPVLRIDIRSGGPLLGSEKGHGWLTGSAIKPIILRYVAEIAGRTDKPVIGIGGVATAEDVLEMLMAGAAAVGLCTAAILNGVAYLTRLNREIKKLLVELKYESPAVVCGAALPNLCRQEVHDRFTFRFNMRSCTACMACVKVCPYQARSLAVEGGDKKMELDEELCRYCGLCASVCPTGALGAERQADGRAVRK